ncbi:TetR family transcriptional regulator [Actinosynnema sp. NPDC023587]|uniref:TetR family transcriptional regulator n=1 Tax=Actinosynnema sp. NPDC023587 TaxID=3154695 RepID=UPI003408954D
MRTGVDPVPGTGEALVAAERLLAERGPTAVPTPADVVRAVVGRHEASMERTRLRMLTEVAESREVRDWVACLVRPCTEHLAHLGRPAWYARFLARALADPDLRRVVVDRTSTAGSVPRVLDGIARCVPALPPPVRLERGAMTRILLSDACARRERALAEGGRVRGRSWEDLAGGLVDAISGVWLAPAAGR